MMERKLEIHLVQRKLSELEKNQISHVQNSSPLPNVFPRDER